MHFIFRLVVWVIVACIAAWLLSIELTWQVTVFACVLGFTDNLTRKA